MKKIVSSVMAGLLLAATAAVAQQEGGNVTRTFVLQTKMGHGDEFREGVKKYWKCYEANDGQWSWNAWSRTSGELGVYVFRSTGHEWRDFDADDPAGEACGDSFDANITPHVAAVHGVWSTAMPEVSRPVEEDMAVAYVGTFWVNNGPKFRELIEQTHAASMKEAWGHYYWGSMMTSDDGADHYIAIMYPSYAAMEPPEQPFWAMQEKVHGKRKTEEMRQALRDVVDKTSWHIYRRVDDLSYTAGN